MIIPILRIFSEEKAKEFYNKFLDFKINFEHKYDKNFPIYMEIEKENWCIHLSEHDDDSSSGTTIMLKTNNLKKYQKELQEKNHKEIKPEYSKTDFSTIEMIINDPFGNKLIFFENI